MQILTVCNDNSSLIRAHFLNMFPITVKLCFASLGGYDEKQKLVEWLAVTKWDF